MVINFYVFSAGNRKLRMVIIGNSGSGKSATAGSILMNPDAFESNLGGQSVTKRCEVRESNVLGNRIMIVDTPGLFDTYRTSDSALLKEIIRALYMTAPGPHAVLLTVAIGRIGREIQDSIHLFSPMFTGCFGQEIIKDNMIVIFTRADDLEFEGIELETFIESAPDEFQQFLRQTGMRYMAFNNRLGNSKAGEDQVKALVRMVREMVNRNGGGYYTNEVLKKAEEKRKEIEMKIREQIKKAEEKRKEVEMKIREQMPDFTWPAPDEKPNRDPELESRQAFQDEDMIL